jgi:HAD superfamily hydrolase (TIGR01509 family)
MKIDRYIDTIVSNQMVVHPKPAPDGYLFAMSKFGISPRDTLIVEDNPKGLKSAYLAGANIMEVRNPSDLILDRIQKFIEVYS